MSWKLFIILFVLIALLALSPIISIVVAGTIASLNGCALCVGRIDPAESLALLQEP